MKAKTHTMRAGGTGNTTTFKVDCNDCDFSTVVTVTTGKSPFADAIALAHVEHDAAPFEEKAE